jgi:hypothetical protein
MKPACFRATLVAVVVLLLPGCSTEHHVTGPLPMRPPAPPVPPAANSPSNAIRLFERGWNHRDLGAFRDVLAGDFAFVFALGDSTGNPFRDDPIGREALLGCLEHLFTGGGSMPPADSILLAFDPTLHPLPDSRPGKDPAWHKEILTSVDLTIMTGGVAEYRIRGDARFFVVRGDSAVIPADLAAKGVRPDPARWYIDRWNDETLREGGSLLRALPAMPQPVRSTTWGSVLALYYQPTGAPRH